MSSDTQPGAAIEVTDALLRGWPLPMPEREADKEQRGRVFVVAGSREMPGAVLLAATAALRAGAGKLAVATGASIATGVALALPEARVIALPESPGGGLAVEGLGLIEDSLRRADAVLVGPGMLDEDETARLVLAILPHCAQAAVVLDAYAMSAVRLQGRFGRPVLLTPHAGEMAHLAGDSKESVADDAAGLARAAAARWNAVLALKGATTHVADPEGSIWRHEGGRSGLGTSGSGDVLAGLATGLAARGASLVQAAVWGVALHARAGRQLDAGRGPLGYLAREIAGEVPTLMHRLGVGA